MGCDVAWKAEAVSPLTGGHFRKVPCYPCATVNLWSNHCSESSSQWRHTFGIQRSIHTGQIEEMQVKVLFWAYDRLQVPDHSLGGYSHRECWSRNRWNIKFEKEMS
jgi:hypothetical protein